MCSNVDFCRKQCTGESLFHPTHNESCSLTHKCAVMQSQTDWSNPDMLNMHYTDNMSAWWCIQIFNMDTSSLSPPQTIKSHMRLRHWSRWIFSPLLLMRLLCKQVIKQKKWMNHKVFFFLLCTSPYKWILLTAEYCCVGTLAWCRYFSTKLSPIMSRRCN